MKCILCEEHEEIIKTEKRKVTYQGKEVEYEHEFCYCSTSDDEYELPYMIDKNLNKVRNNGIKIVTMPIHKKWFNLILSGDKKEEYREIKEYWRKRLLHDKTTHLRLVNGYGANAPYLLIEVKNIKTGTGKEEWGAVPGEQYYVLELGEIIASGNLIYKPLDKIKAILDLEFQDRTVVKEGTVGEITDIKKYKDFVLYGVQFEGYDNIYILDQSNFKKI